MTALPAGRSLLVVAILASVVSGCSTGASEESSTQQSPTPQAAPATADGASPPAQSPASPSALVVSTTGIALVDQAGRPLDGRTAEFDEPAEGAVALLSVELGDPTVEEYQSAFAEGVGTMYRWQGLAIDEFAGADSDADDASPAWGVALTTARVAQLELRTMSDLAVGASEWGTTDETACGTVVAEAAAGRGIELRADDDGTLVSLRSPVLLDACE